jgi:hypothetical protein
MAVSGAASATRRAVGHGNVGSSLPGVPGLKPDVSLPIVMNLRDLESSRPVSPRQNFAIEPDH